jgi:heme-degrading monooxygenase HmoA
MAVCFVLEVRVKPGFEDEFPRRYDALSARVAAGLDGHVRHQLCQANDDPQRWLILSEWETLEAAQEWERSDEHRELTLPLRECWEDARRAGYVVRLETTRGRAKVDPLPSR